MTKTDPAIIRATRQAKALWGTKGWSLLPPETRRAYVALFLLESLPTTIPIKTLSATLTAFKETAP